jgi:hypothetical protein
MVSFSILYWAATCSFCFNLSVIIIIAFNSVSDNFAAIELAIVALSGWIIAADVAAAAAEVVVVGTDDGCDAVDRVVVDAVDDPVVVLLGGRATKVGFGWTEEAGFTVAVVGGHVVVVVVVVVGTAEGGGDTVVVEAGGGCCITVLVDTI